MTQNNKQWASYEIGMTCSGNVLRSSCCCLGPTFMVPHFCAWQRNCAQFWSEIWKCLTNLIKLNTISVQLNMLIEKRKSQSCFEICFTWSEQILPLPWLCQLVHSVLNRHISLLYIPRTRSLHCCSSFLACSLQHSNFFITTYLLWKRGHIWAHGIREPPQKNNRLFLGLWPKLWVGGGQES